MNETLLWCLLGLDLLLSAACLTVVLLLRARTPGPKALERLQSALSGELRTLRGEWNADLQQALRTATESTLNAQQQTASLLEQRLQTIQTGLTGQLQAIQTGMTEQLQAIQAAMNEQLRQVDARLAHSSQTSELKLDNIRTAMETRLTAMQQANTHSLEQMRQTVDEKLQKTLEEKLQRSFETVSAQLEQVYRGLGEMQNLANGVGDLKKVLSNVKTRGILGEIQLGSILEEILTPEQYERNVVTRPGRRDPVEFAIRLPGDGSKPVLLPIDAKFPLDLYARLNDAYDSGDAAAIEAAGRELEQRMRGCAKDIHDKYIEPPYTTEFAILFLPTEGLYAEVVRRGMVEKLQHDFKVNIAGPSTMAALLNSLQMGFQTLAIQKRSSEVWQVLAGVKTEFDTFAAVLTQAQNRIRQANDELDKLIGVRTRQMQRRLKQVQQLEDPAVPALTAFSDTADEEV